MKSLTLHTLCLLSFSVAAFPASAHSRAELETRLLKPAELELPQAGAITVDELLTQIQQKHGVRVRLDRAVRKLMDACLQQAGGILGHIRNHWLQTTRDTRHERTKHESARARQHERTKE